MGILTRPADRRAAPRRSPDQVRHITGVKVCAEEVHVIDASRDGIVVEGTVRLNPGTERPVEIWRAGAPTRVRARVLRCQVMGRSPNGLRYQTAFAFDRTLNWLEEEEGSNGRTATVPCAPSAFEMADLELADPDPTLRDNSW